MSRSFFSLSASPLQPFVYGRLFETVRRFDFALLGSAVVLVVFGLLALYSLDGGTVGWGSKMIKQIGWLALSFIVFIGFASLNPDQIRKGAWWFLGFAVLLLTAVLLVGQTTHGTTGWIRFGEFGFQPVEIAKIILVIALARLMGSREFSLNAVVAGSFLLAAALFGLVCLQPDFGSGMLFLIIWFGMIILRGVSWKIIGAVVCAGVLAAVIGWSLLAPYQQSRIMTFLDPTSDTSGASYQAIQSIVTVGSGELFGRGLGLGSQSQLRFLPEASTDFVFAAIAEEFGFVGIILFFSAFVLLGTRLFQCARFARDDFSYLLVGGLFILLSAQLLINAAMNVGLFPITGIPLPLVSYGGSSLMSTFIALGIIQSIRRHQKTFPLS